jgi:hypothetical protein
MFEISKPKEIKKEWKLQKSGLIMFLKEFEVKRTYQRKTCLYLLAEISCIIIFIAVSADFEK